MGKYDLTLFTYTNSKCSDLHEAYFSRLNLYSNFKKFLTVCDTEVKNTKTFVYKNDEDFYLHMIGSLNEVSSEFLIYSQEDYILFDYVNTDIIYKYIDVMDSDKSISFIRLIQSGIGDDIKYYNDDLIEVDRKSMYYYSTQATIWRKSDLLNMFDISKPKSIRDEVKNSYHLRNMNKIGLCTKLKGNRVGGHFNSKVYPYIATALVQGKWNISEYDEELSKIFLEYSINKNERL
jgi:hypothetical protein